GEGDWDMLTVTNTEEYGGPPFSGSSPDGAGTVTNLFTNPDMQATSGEVVVWENLIPNPSFEYGTDGWSFSAGVTGRLTSGPNGRVSGSYSLELEALDGADNNNVQATTTVGNVPEGGFLSVRQSIRRGTT